MLGNERTLKTGLTLTRNGNFNPDEVAGAGFYQFTVAEVAAEVRYRGVALMIEVDGHLDFERVVKYGFGDLLEQAVFADDLSGGLIAGDELLNKFLTGKTELRVLLLLCGHVRLLNKLGSLAKCSSTKKPYTLQPKHDAAFYRSELRHNATFLRFVARALCLVCLCGSMMADYGCAADARVLWCADDRSAAFTSSSITT